METIGFHGRLKTEFEQAIELIQKGLNEQGFSIVTRIDMHSTFKEKIDVEFRKYSILGACNARFAHQIIVADPKAGLLLPCNITVEALTEGETNISFIKPTEMLSLGEIGKNEKISEIAAEAEKRLLFVANNLFSLS